MLTDCHTHLESFTEREVGEVIGRARDAGVGLVITAGTTVKSSHRAGPSQITRALPPMRPKR